MSNSTSDDSAISWTSVGNSTCIPYDDPDALWPYCPSEAAAIAFAVLFGLSALAHIFFAAKHSKKFCWVIILSAIWESAGYAVRADATRYQQDLTLYFVQLLLVLLSPLLINAFVYMVFARMVYYFLPAQKVAGIRASRLSIIFVCVDIFSFLVQLTGAGQLASTDADTVQTGKYIYMGGMGFQQLGILIFASLVVVFWREADRVSGHRQVSHRFLTILVFASLGFITVRIIFRILEYSQGFDSTIPRTESFQYIFDAAPMFLTIVGWTILHPGRVLVGEGSDFPKLSRNEKKILKQEKKAAKKAKKEGKDTNTGMEPIRPYGSFDRLSPENRYDQINLEERGTYRDISPGR